MTEMFEDTGLRNVGLMALAAVLIMVGVKFINNQLDLDVGIIDAEGEKFVIKVLCGIAIISGVLLAFRGKVCEGMIIVLPALMEMTYSFAHNADIIVTIALIVALVFCIIKEIKDDESNMAIFALFYILLSIVGLIYINKWVDVVTDGSAMIGVIAIVDAIMALIIVNKGRYIPGVDD